MPNNPRFLVGCHVKPRRMEGVFWHHKGLARRGPFRFLPEVTGLWPLVFRRGPRAIAGVAAWPARPPPPRPAGTVPAQVMCLMLRPERSRGGDVIADVTGGLMTRGWCAGGQRTADQSLTSSTHAPMAMGGEWEWNRTRWDKDVSVGGEITGWDETRSALTVHQYWLLRAPPDRLRTRSCIPALCSVVVLDLTS